MESVFFFFLPCFLAAPKTSPSSSLLFFYSKALVHFLRISSLCIERKQESPEVAKTGSGTTEGGKEGKGKEKEIEGRGSKRGKKDRQEREIGIRVESKRVDESCQRQRYVNIKCTHVTLLTKHTRIMEISSIHENAETWAKLT